MAFFKNLLTVGAGTALTRILGFLRDMAIAASLGTGPIADAFVVAFRLPNLVRRVFGEGAFNAAFVPLYLRMPPKEAAAFTGLVFSSFIGLMLAFSFLFLVLMPWLMPFFAPGFETGAQFERVVSLTRLAFPFLFFMAIMAVLGAVLNAHNRFLATSFAPALLNLVLLCILGLSYETHEKMGQALAIGVSLAGFLQAFMLFIALKKAKLMFPFVRPKLTPRLKLLFWRSFPSLLTAGIAQINILIGTIIATYQFSGVAWLYYADRLYQLPLGIIGIALGVVLLNDLTKAKQGGDVERFEILQNQALVLSLALAMPAFLGLFMGAEIIVSVLFERGAFTAVDSLATAQALKGFALGLPFFVLIKVFANRYFANENTSLPFKASIYGLIANFFLCLLLFKPFGVAGLALATSFSGFITLVVLAFPLLKMKEIKFKKIDAYRLCVVLIASSLMGVTLKILAPANSLFGLSLFILCGLLSYALVLAFFHFLCFKVFDFKGFDA